MAKDEMDVVSVVLSTLADKVGRDRMQLWLRDGEALRIEGGTLLVRAADQFTLDRIRRHLREPLLAAAEAALGERLNIEFRVDPELKRGEAAAGKSSRRVAHDPNQRTFNFGGEEEVSTSNVPNSNTVRPAESATPTASRPSAVPEVENKLFATRRFARLETFVVSEASRLAHAAAMRIATQPGRITPLYLHGPTGCGKTHLAEGVWCSLRKITGKTCVFLAAEQFTTLFLDSLRGQGMPNFRRKIRDADLLVIDDIQFLNGKPATLRELLSTLDFFIRERKQLVITGDRVPHELPGLGPEIAARLSEGLVADLPSLDVATRRGVLVQMVSQQHRKLSDEVLDFLAASLPGDGRRLQGALNRLEAMQEAMATTNPSSRQVTVSFAREALKDLIKGNQKMVRLIDIDKAVCEVFGIATQGLHTNGKSKSVTQPRMLAMWLARKYTRAGLSEISNHFGLRSHSTVVAAQKKVVTWLEQQTPLGLLQEECAAAEAIRRVELVLRAV